MGKVGTVKVEVHLVSLKFVTPIVPKDEKEKQQLVEDLTRMECEGLLVELWMLKSKAMVQEFLQARSNEWEGTMWRDPERWTAHSWVEVYSFRKEGRGLASRTNKYIDGKFSTSVNPKDGHAIANCVDSREKRVLEFIVPILYLEKSNWITMMVCNTIFGALSGLWKVSWRQVIQEVVGKLVFNLEKGKPSPISPYLFHLYHWNECLKEEEMDTLESAKCYIEYGINPEVETQPDVVEIDSERELLSSAKQRKILVASLGSRKKFTYWSPEGKSPVQNPDWKAIAMRSFEFEDHPFQWI